MPELPDLTVYLERLAPRIVGQPLVAVDLRSLFVLRSVSPPLSAAQGRRVVDLSRLGKRIVWEMEGGLFIVFHLMIAGRFHWKARGAKTGGKQVSCTSVRARKHDSGECEHCNKGVQISFGAVAASNSCSTQWEGEVAP